MSAGQLNRHLYRSGPALLGWPRQVVSGWWYQLKMQAQSGFVVMVSLVQPLIFASIAMADQQAGNRTLPLLYYALGAGIMGIWSTVVFGCGGALSWQRHQGMLEPLVMVPAPLVLVLLGITLGTASVGLYSMGATLLWGWLIFGAHIHLVDPFAFVIAAVVMVVALGLLGLVLGATFVLYRNANALSNALEYPVWLVCGLVVPLSLLPGWTHYLAYILAPTWGIEAMRTAALGGNPWVPLLWCAVASVVYLGVGVVLVSNVERLSRAHATLTFQ
ncbi:MAG TPA: ABC transporter permease [Candidatus Dormibacteraeota bacterium]|nr:ABC transporter permease [Candidatus Dormibacteraeota bacterium]